MSNRHAHIQRYATSCDGPFSSHRVEVMNDAEIAESGQEVNDFSEINFRERVMSMEISLTTYRDGQEGGARFHEHGFNFWRSTDEGGENVEVIWCEDDCDLGARGQRDVYAEMMNY